MEVGKDSRVIRKCLRDKFEAGKIHKLVRDPGDSRDRKKLEKYKGGKNARLTDGLDVGTK